MLMNRLVQVAMVLFVSCLAARAEEPSKRKELARHQGEWLVVSFERNGEVTAKEITDTIMRVVENDHVVWKREGKSFAGTSMVLDPNAEPPTIDLLPDGGPARDKRVRGIYKLQGDTLTICVADPDSPRPLKFSAPKGSGHTLQTFRRKPK
jgi:uncharacterized protein (TIGR03067 family)